MLDAQLEDFAARRRFADAVLGLVSVTERTRALARRPSPNPKPAGPDAAAVTDFLLGIISAGRTLRATLSAARADVRDAKPDRRPPAGTGNDDRILR
jgi:hypothetical protein